MPTNPLWIEHTEKAAWDTVQALRNEIDRARQELDRMKELQPALSAILELLDDAKRTLGLKGADPAELARELIGKLRDVSSPQNSIRSNAVRWFARMIERRRQPGPELDPAALKSTLELRVRELGDAPADELCERAISIGHLAFELARATRKKR